MKTVIIISLLAIVFTSAQGQNENSFFKHERIEMAPRLLKVTPKIEKCNLKGKIAASLIPNDDYFVELFSTIAKKSFTKDEIESLDTKGNSLFLRYHIDNEGNFLCCEFLLGKQAIKSISEDNLLKFYNSVMKTKIDTSMWGEINKEFLGSNGKFDFIRLTNKINPKGIDELNKWRNKQRSKGKHTK